MKTILLIGIETLSNISDTARREDIEFRIRSWINDYNNNCKLYKEIYTSKHTEPNEIYIDTLLELVDYLYGYYEIDQKFFELLNTAAINLIHLYTEQIKKSSDEVVKTEKQIILADYLNKTAMIFQTASDKAESSGYPELYEIKAKEYSEIADAVFGIEQKQEHRLKMADLYEKATETERFVKHKDGAFLKNIFLSRARECREKYKTEKTAKDNKISSDFFAHFNNESKTTSENEPLLGLHKRKVTSEESQQQCETKTSLPTR